MKTGTLILRSVRHYARSHLGTLLGASIASAILIGALVVGDSVRASLRAQAYARLGNVQLALASQDRLFRGQLVAFSMTRQLHAFCAAVLQLPATVTTADSSARANQVQVLGVDDRFWRLAAGPPPFKTMAEDEVVLNERLARQLKIKTGDTLLLRVPKPTQLSRDAPLAPDEGTSVALRLKVGAVVSDRQFGRFSLQASQVPPFNAFVRLDVLQKSAGVPGRANLLLVGRKDFQPPADLEPNFLTTDLFPTVGEGVRSTGPKSGNFISDATDALRRVWQLADAQLELKSLPEQNTIELRTGRVFLDPPVAEAARQAAAPATRILTYFVNEFRSGTRSTPYSMVTAAEPPLVPADLKDDEILINQWLADDLGAAPGASIELRFYVVGLGRQLEERTAAFRIRGLLPMTGPAADRTLMPDFPGLTDADNCRDWDTGFPIDSAKIREHDEKYWDDYRGTPKAFVTLAAGQKMWGNRFGDLTAIRYSTGGTTNASATASIIPDRTATRGPSPQRETNLTNIAANILNRLDPAAVGLRFEPVRELADASVAQSQDFGGLFIGFSFFLIAAALILMGLLFQFGLEQRSVEIGTLLALGFAPRQVRLLFLFEGGVLSLVGAILGVIGGTIYARAMLLGLSTVWNDAVGTSTLEYHGSPMTLTIGLASSVAVAWLTLWVGLRRHARRPARELIAGGGEEHFELAAPHGRRWSLVILLISGIGAAGMVAMALTRSGEPNPGLFFGAGALLLIAGLAGCAAKLGNWGSVQHPGSATGKDSPERESSTKEPGTHKVRNSTGQRFTLRALAIRNCARRRKRSLAAIGLLASGSFLVASIGVFRLDAVRGAELRSSGTGGFALIGESSLAVVHNLNTPTGRDFFGLDAVAMTNVQVVPMRVRAGEEASCLNLNRAQRPRLVGVRSELLAERGAFSFAKSIGAVAGSSPWLLLKHRAPDDAVPAIGDQASILWAMGKKVGDTIDFVDERGRPFKVRIVGAVANSILQGNLLIDEEQFVARFPGESGYRMFLVDAPSNRVDAVATTLTRALRDVGIELTRTTQRLAEFNAVQNTYLGTFQILGGLGLVLGSVGLGVLVLRNVLERRAELALLLAVGFSRRTVKILVAGEHGALLLSGLIVGVAAAAVAVVPAVSTAGTEVPYGSLGLTLAGILVSGAIWTLAAVALALKGPLLDALRSE